MILALIFLCYKIHDNDPYIIKKIHSKSQKSKYTDSDVKSCDFDQHQLWEKNKSQRKGRKARRLWEKTLNVSPTFVT